MTEKASSAERKAPEKRTTHEMTFWPDMNIQIDKLARMGVRVGVSRNDFNRISEARKALEKVNFAEIRFIRKTPVDDIEHADLFGLLSGLQDDILRQRVEELLKGMDRKTLERTYLMVLSCAGKEFFV